MTLHFPFPSVLGNRHSILCFQVGQKCGSSLTGWLELRVSPGVAAKMLVGALVTKAALGWKVYFQRGWQIDTGKHTRHIIANRLRTKDWKKNLSSGRCGSVDWVPACEPKSHWFRYQARAHAWVGGQVLGGGCTRDKHTLMCPSLSPSLPHSKNK